MYVRVRGAEWCNAFQPSFVFAHATCFDDRLMAQLAAAVVPSLPPGCLIASVSKAMPSPLLQTLEHASDDGRVRDIHHLHLVKAEHAA